MRQSLSQHPACRIIWLAWCIVAALLMASGSQALLAQEETVTPEAKAQTVPVPHGGDAADDPAIWIHPTDPEKSLLLGTDKRADCTRTIWTAATTNWSPMVPSRTM